MDFETPQPQPLESYEGSSAINYLDNLGTSQSNDDLALFIRSIRALTTYRHGDYAGSGEAIISFGQESGKLVVLKEELYAEGEDEDDEESPKSIVEPEVIADETRADYIKNIKIIRNGNNLFIIDLKSDPKLETDSNQSLLIESVQQVDRNISGLLSTKSNRPKIFLIHNPDIGSILALGEGKNCKFANDFVNIEVADRKGLFDEKKSLQAKTAEDVGHQLTHFYMEGYENVHGTGYESDPLWQKLVSAARTYEFLLQLNGAPDFYTQPRERVVKAVLNFIHKKNPVLGIVGNQQISEALERVNYDPKKLVEVAEIIETEELPNAYREGFAILMGKVVSNNMNKQELKDLERQIQDADLHNLYRLLDYKSFSELILPSFLDHLRDYYAIPMFDLANAVTRTTKQNYDFNDFCSNLNIDYQDALKTWKQSLN